MKIRLGSGFKIRPPFHTDNTPIHHVDLEEGVLGKANKNGTILVSDKITDPEERQSVIDHEKVHIDQIKRGDLDYDDDFVYWKGKKYSRDDICRAPAGALQISLGKLKHTLKLIHLKNINYGIQTK